MKKLGLWIIGFLIAYSSSFANNLVLGTPTIGAGGTTVSFTIKWDNSWYVTTGPSNWDAVWIFVKRQACDQPNQNPWLHADLSSTSSSHTVTGSQLQVDLPSDNKGVFVRRSAAGLGNIAQVTVTLTLASALAAGENISVYGIEMVNVPEGQFYIGDGRAGGGDHGWNFTDGNSDNPKLITQAIQASGIGAVTVYSKANIGSNVALGSSFPLGYNRFYCMKYEITTSQFINFLNALTYDQQLRMVRDPNATPLESAQGTLIFNTFNGFRLEIKTPGTSLTTKTPAVFGLDATNDNNYDQADDGLGLAMAMGTKHFLSYLDWAALRPMTEFEYEKACRGTLNPVSGEYVWGTTDLRQFSNYNVSNRFTANEVLSGSGLGMANIATNISYRVGIAATATSNRVNAGATYYGILDMAGSQHERVVGFHNSNYSTFTTANGDGNLTTNAFSDVVGWSESIIGARGSSWRRGDGQTVSSRSFIVWGVPSGTNSEADWADFGGRGVRSF